MPGTKPTTKHDIEEAEASMELSMLDRSSKHSTTTKQQRRQRQHLTNPSSSSCSQTTFVIDHSSFTVDNNSLSTCADGTSKSRQSFVTVVDPSVLRMISIARGEAEEEEEEDVVSERKSQIWCFVVCDLVTACVAMNSIYIVLLVFHLVISLIDSEHFDMRVKLYREVPRDDDLYNNVTEQLVLDPWAVVRYTKNAAGVLFSVMGIIGALKFKKSLVLLSAVWHCVYILLSLVNRTWIGCFLTVPFAYTSFHLWVALRAGTITPENYRKTERHCCCCRRRGSNDDDP